MTEGRLRLFFAIELPARIQSALSAWQQRDDTAYRWVDPAMLHVTLAFLGEQPEQRLPGLSLIGTDAAARVPAFTLRLGDAGSFGPRRAPRVLWVGIGDGRSALGDLNAHLADGLRRSDFPVEDRPFAPHITLARRREGAPAAGPPAWPPASAGTVSTRVTQLTLMQSQLGRGGARYTAVEHFPLAGVTDG
jgi:2'-5' RNA ligase